MNDLAVMEPEISPVVTHEAESTQFVTFLVADQLFGVDVLNVQDILRTENIAFVPMAPPEVKGSINLRGRIVTVIDVRVRLGLPPLVEDEKCMGVTVEKATELYTLRVDEIGEVLALPLADHEEVPGTLEPKWREFADGIYQLEDNLMIVLDIDKLLEH